MIFVCPNVLDRVFLQSIPVPAMELQTLPEGSRPAGRKTARRVYRCDLCHRVVGPGTRALRRVVEKRRKQYPYRAMANHLVYRRKNEKPKEFFIDDPGGTGEETVKEITICPACAGVKRA